MGNKNSIDNKDNALLSVPIVLLIAGLAFDQDSNSHDGIFRVLSLSFFIALIIYYFIKSIKSGILISLIIFLYLLVYSGTLLGILQYPGAEWLSDIGKYVHIPLAIYFGFHYFYGQSGKGNIFYIALSAIYLLMISDVILNLLPIETGLFFYPMVAFLITIQVNQNYENIHEQRLLLLLTADAFIALIAMLFKLI